MTKKSSDLSRRSLLKGTAAATAATAVAPSIFVPNATAAGAFRNDPGNSSTVTLGFNVPQTGAYMTRGADELRAFKLAVKHLNGEGDGGMMQTMQPMNLKGNGILGKKVEFVTGDTQTKSDAARASAKRMIEKDGVIMFLRWFFIWCGDRGSVFGSGNGHSLHGGSDSLKRHHR